MNDPSVLALGATVLQSDINSAARAGAGIQSRIPASQGNVAQALRKYPQYQDDPVARRADRRESVPRPRTRARAALLHGLQAGWHTHTRSCTTTARRARRATTGSTTPCRIPSDPLEWSLSADDTPHVFLTGFTWEVPGSEQVVLGIAKALLAGWNISGVLRYESGRPLNITMANDLGGFLFNGQKRPNRVGVDADGVAEVGNFDPNADRYFNPAAWTDPGPLQFGNAVRRDGTVRGFPNYSEDVNIFKVFPMAEQQKDAVRGDVREYLQPDAVLRSEHELELRQLRHGQHAMQPAAVGPVRTEVRFLIRRESKPDNGATVVTCEREMQ